MYSQSYIEPYSTKRIVYSADPTTIIITITASTNDDDTKNCWVIWTFFSLFFPPSHIQLTYLYVMHTVLGTFIGMNEYDIRSSNYIRTRRGNSAHIETTEMNMTRGKKEPTKGNTDQQQQIYEKIRQKNIYTLV